MKAYLKYEKELFSLACMFTAVQLKKKVTEISIITKQLQSFSFLIPSISGMMQCISSSIWLEIYGYAP